MDEIITESFFLQPGFIFVSRQPYLVNTVLGSCVGLCVWDEVEHFGGLNHFVYSRPFKKEAGARYGSISIPYMFRLLMQLGAKKENLRTHIIGGAQNPELNSFIGDENVRVAEEWLEKKRITVVSRDIGGQVGRKVIFNNHTGEVWVYKLQNIRTTDWFHQP